MLQARKERARRKAIAAASNSRRREARVAAAAAAGGGEGSFGCCKWASYLLDLDGDDDPPIDQVRKLGAVTRAPAELATHTFGWIVNVISQGSLAFGSSAGARMQRSGGLNLEAIRDSEHTAITSLLILGGLLRPGAVRCSMPGRCEQPSRTG